MTEKFSNDWTREVEKLRADKAVLLEACKNALNYIRYVSEEAAYLSGNSAWKNESSTGKFIKAAIAQAEKEES